MARAARRSSRRLDWLSATRESFPSTIWLSPGCCGETGMKLSKEPSATFRVALVHDRLEQYGGAERGLGAIHTIFPDAPIYTPIWNRQAVPAFEGCDVRTTWMQGLPGISN